MGRFRCRVSKLLGAYDEAMNESLGFELKGPITFRHAVLYDSNPTIGEETTVTLIDADGTVESVTHVYAPNDDD